MWLLRVIVFVALLVVAIWVSLQNSEQLVDVHLFSWDFPGVRLYLVMFASAVLGLVAGLLLGAIREVRVRMTLSRERKERQVLQREVQDLRAAPLQGLDAESTLPARRPE